MPVSQLPQAPHRQDRKVFPTPLIGDVLFSEIRDCNRILIPEYGTPHPDTNKWPNHKLVFVKPVDIERNEIFEFFYAADRENQDLYNWSHSEADIGSNKFDAIARDYIIPRDEFDPEAPLQGATMPNIPEGVFTEDHVLASRLVVESPVPELASVYIFEKRVYLKKVPLVDIEINRETGTAQQITSTLYYRGEIVGGVAIEDLVDNTTNAYWELDENGFGNVAKQLSENWWEVTQRQWINLEDVWEWELDRRGPKQFFCPADETTITETSSNNIAGPYYPLPDVPIGQLVRILKWGKYMRYTTVTRNIDGLKIVDELNYLPDDGYAYPTQNELISDDNVPSARESITGDGRATEYSAIEGCLAVKSTKQVLSLEEETQKAKSKLIPEKYLISGSAVSTLIETSTTELPLPEVASGEEAVLSNKGNIYKLKTTTQGGHVELKGAEVNTSDGISYETTEEVVPIDSIAPEDMDADGNATTFTPINATHAIKSVKNVLSVEDETQKAKSKLIPEKYLISGSAVSTLIETSTTELPLPEVASGEEAVLSNKGNIYKLKTTTQGGHVELKGAEVNTSDGISYETTEEVVPIDSIAPEDMDADGNATTFTPINATHAIKSVKNVLSVEDETQKVSNRLPPDKFFEGGGKPKTTIEIEISDAPADLACGLDESVQRTSKGLIHQTKTTTFEGDSVKLPSTSFDQRTGIGYLEDQEVVPLDEVTETSVDEDGKVAVFEPYNADYAIKTTKRVASPETKTWTDIVNYEWPPVLEDLYIKTYQKRNGTVLSVPVIKYRSAFTGPQEVDVTQYWQKEPYVPVSPQQMLPEGFRFQCMYFTVDMPPCLHDTVNFAVSTGTNDPVWENYSETDSFPATNHITWPASITWSESKPYMGGYLVTEWVINRPE